MKPFSWILMFCLFAFSSAQAQEGKLHQIDNGVGGVEFTELSIMGAVPDGEGTRVYLELGRIGAIQSVAGPIMSGGNDPVTVKALGILEFDAAFELTKEELQWLKPDGAPKKFNILAQPGKVLGDKLATHEDCVTIPELADKYPDLLELHMGKSEEMEPVSYYNSTLDYSMLRGMAKKMRVSFVSFDKDGKKTTEDKEIDMEGYRSSNKKDYWRTMQAPNCDLTSGRLWAFHGHMVEDKAYRSRGDLFFQEVVVFDKEGEVVERTDIEFKKPHLTLLTQFLYERNDDGMTDIVGKAHVYGQAFGLGYKKLNPSPDEKSRLYYEWDGEGNLVQKVEFNAPDPSLKSLYVHKGNDKRSILCYSGQAKSYYLIDIKDDKSMNTQKLGNDHPIVAGMKKMSTLLPSSELKHVRTENMINSTVRFYRMVKTSSTAGQAATVTNIGDILFFTDKKGEILSSYVIPTPQEGNASDYQTYPSDDDIILVATQGTKSVSVLKINDAGSIKELYSSKADDQSASASYLKENNQLVISTLTADKKLEIQLIGL